MAIPEGLEKVATVPTPLEEPEDPEPAMRVKVPGEEDMSYFIIWLSSEEIKAKEPEMAIPRPRLKLYEVIDVTARELRSSLRR
jgi:hypothetical protein